MLYTNNYGLNMPEYMESADIRDLNENTETIDSLLHNGFTNSADAYDSAQTYAVGDIVIYENKLYKCTTAVASAESFDSTKWTQTSLGEILETIKNSIGGFITPVNNPSERDLNNYLKTAIISANFTGYSNYPASHPYALLEVVASATYIKQTITLLGENETTFYIRMWAGGLWRSWRAYTPS